MNRPQTDADLAWDWCVREYAREGIAAEMLRRQDEQGLDVMQHLFVRWLAECHDCTLDPYAQAELALAVREWREQIVQPLRALRRILKAKPAPGAGLNEQAEVLRGLIKQAELQSEKAQLAMMCEWVKASLSDPSRIPACRPCEDQCPPSAGPTPS